MGSSYNRYQLRYKPADNVAQFFLGDSSDYTIVNSNSDLSIGVWTHLSATWDGTNMLLFVNGQEQSDTGTFTGSPSLSYEILEIGRYTDINYYGGGIDEVRISNVKRSSCWISTEYNNQFDPDSFYTIGSEENASGGIVWESLLNFIGPDNITDTLVFGEAIYAKDGQDSFDEPKSGYPSFPYVYAWFDANLSGPYEMLRKDYRKYPNSENIWDFYVIYGNGESKNITIKWDPIYLNESEYDTILLIDSENNLSIDMKQFDNYTYHALSDSIYHFQIKCNVTPIFSYDIQLSEDWNLITIPVNDSINKNNIKVNYLGVNHSWQDAVDNNTILGFIYKWNVTNQNYEFAETLIPGECYWIYAFEICTLFIESEINIVDEFTNKILQNWNLVGLPNVNTINKDQLKIVFNNSIYTWQQAVDSGIILDFVYGWNVIIQAYELTDYIIPNQGFWIYAYHSCFLKMEE